MHKGKQYLWRKHRDNTRAFSQPSVIWFLGDEYERTGNSRQKRFWRCGICKGTTMLACRGGSSSGLRHLKKKHRIDKQGQRIMTNQRAITSVLSATATTVATLVTSFNVNKFRYLFIRWIMTMHIALTCVESDASRDWVIYISPALLWDHGLIEQQDSDDEVLWRDGRANLYSIHLFLAIILLVFPPNTLFHRHRPIGPVRLTGFQQARQAFP